MYIVGMEKKILSTRPLLFYLTLLIIAVYLIGFFFQNVKIF